MDCAPPQTHGDNRAAGKDGTENAPHSWVARVVLVVINGVAYPSSLARETARMAHKPRQIPPRAARLNHVNAPFLPRRNDVRGVSRCLWHHHGLLPHRAGSVGRGLMSKRATLDGVPIFIVHSLAWGKCTTNNEAAKQSIHSKICSRFTLAVLSPRGQREAAPISSGSATLLCRARGSGTEGRRRQ